MEKELSTEEWKQKKKEQRAIFTARQRLPYEIKLKRQALREPAVRCVDSESIWNSVRIDLTGYGKEIRKPGIFGCTVVAQIRRLARNMAGEEYLITLELSGRTSHQYR
jgi:hypothetical protein